MVCPRLVKFAHKPLVVGPAGNQWLVSRTHLFNMLAARVRLDDHLLTCLICVGQGISGFGYAVVPKCAQELPLRTGAGQPVVAYIGGPVVDRGESVERN